MTKFNMLTVVVSVISLIVAAAALIFSWYTYDNYHNKQIQSRQIETVVSLTDYIHKTKLKFEYHNTQSSNARNRTLFELRRYDSLPTGNTPIYFHNNDNCPLNFDSFATNPFMPTEIADVLVKFYPHDKRIGFDLVEPTLKTEYCILSSLKSVANEIAEQNKSILDENLMTIETLYYYKHSSALGLHNDLVRYGCDLKEVIINWYNKQGIDNINIRDNDCAISL